MTKIIRIKNTGFFSCDNFGDNNYISIKLLVSVIKFKNRLKKK